MDGDVRLQNMEKFLLKKKANVGLKELKKKIEGESEKTVNIMMETCIYTLPSWLGILSKFT